MARNNNLRKKVAAPKIETILGLPWWLPPLALFSLATWFGSVIFISTPKILDATEQSMVNGAAASVLPKDSTASSNITIVAGGDVMLSRYVGEQIRRHNDPSWPFQEIAPVFTSADLAFANLEAPFAKFGTRTALKDTLVFKAEPEAAAGLKQAGFDVMSLANNHIMNQGRAGLAETLKLLQENNIAVTGAGVDNRFAHAPAVLTVKGVRFAFLSYAFPHDATVATAARPGIADMDIVQMNADVVAAKAFADVVIVSMHAGSEYSKTPSSAQKTFARAAIDAGAAVVLGHHPHVVQPLEQYHGGMIAFSLGNLVFDQLWSAETQLGLVLRLDFSASRLISADLLPIKIEHGGQPTWASGSDRIQVLKNTGESTGSLIVE